MTQRRARWGSPSWALRAVTGHLRTVGALATALLAYPCLPAPLGGWTRAILAWDLGAIVLLAASLQLFLNEGSDVRMARNADAQQEGEWTMFAASLGGVAFSFAALVVEMPTAKDLAPGLRGWHVGLVGATILLSWLVTHTVFALRYAHEYYTTSPGGAGVDGGLDFPGTEPPDYWDFVYFSLVLGMTFQVSDVQITSRKFRRLATFHGLVGFVFNTVMLALAVNIAAGLLN